MQRPGLLLVGVILLGLLTPFASADARPDLRVDSVVVQPDPAVAGDHVVVHALIVNAGDAPASWFFVRFFVDGVAKGDRSLTLAAGQSAWIQSDAWTAVAGSHTALVKADTTNSVAESNEANNWLQRSFQVLHEDPEPADLAITDLRPSTWGPREGDFVFFTATVTNRGGSASQASTVRFIVDTFTHDEKAIPTLQPGQTITVTAREWCAVLGSHAVSAHADPEARQADGNRSNNHRTVGISVAPAIRRGVDLSPEVQEASVLPMQDVSYDIVVKNTGNDFDVIRLERTAAPAGWSATLSRSFVSLAPGQSTVVKLDVRAPLAVQGEARVSVTGRSWNAASVFDTVETRTSLPLA